MKLDENNSHSWRALAAAVVVELAAALCVLAYSLFSIASSQCASGLALVFPSPSAALSLWHVGSERRCVPYHRYFCCLLCYFHRVAPVARIWGPGPAVCSTNPAPTQPHHRGYPRSNARRPFARGSGDSFGGGRMHYWWRFDHHPMVDFEV